jgi:hypothetical protein
MRFSGCPEAPGSFVDRFADARDFEVFPALTRASRLDSYPDGPGGVAVGADPKRVFSEFHMSAISVKMPAMALFSMSDPRKEG